MNPARRVTDVLQLNQTNANEVRKLPQLGQTEETKVFAEWLRKLPRPTETPQARAYARLLSRPRRRHVPRNYFPGK